jgi:hypothetical protein
LGIIRLILGAGANPTIRNNAGKTVLGLILAGHGDEAAIPLLEAAIVEPQRARTLFKARALIDGARTIDKAFPDALKTKRSRVAFTQALLAAAPPYLKGRVADGLPTPWVLLVEKRLVALGSNRAEEERQEVMAAMASMVAAEEELVATVKYVLGLEGGGVVFQGQEPTVGMLPEVLAELLELMVPKWDPALKGHPLGEGMH